MSYFFDSSALVKRYAQEVGSAWVCSLISGIPRGAIFIAKITGPEVIAALARKQRMGEISVADYQQAVADFTHDFHHSYTQIELTDYITIQAMVLPQRRVLRGYDAVQLASAFWIDTVLKQSGQPVLTFISADNALCNAAQAEGLVTDNPNNH
jgi:predicted nucleic acid-binding protein